MEVTTISEIIGLNLLEAQQNDFELTLKFTNGASILFYHRPDCCETVEIEDVTGDWSDLVGHPLLVAEERVSSDHHPDFQIPEGSASADSSNTWTFYTFRNAGGTVDVRWHGSSNGYYSESVDWDFSPPAST